MRINLDKLPAFEVYTSVDFDKAEAIRNGLDEMGIKYRDTEFKGAQHFNIFCDDFVDAAKVQTLFNTL